MVMPMEMILSIILRTMSIDLESIQSNQRERKRSRETNTIPEDALLNLTGRRGRAVNHACQNIHHHFQGKKKAAMKGHVHFDRSNPNIYLQRSNEPIYSFPPPNNPQSHTHIHTTNATNPLSLFPGANKMQVKDFQKTQCEPPNRPAGELDKILCSFACSQWSKR